MKALEFLQHKLQVLDDSIAKDDPFIVKTRAELRDAIEELKTMQADAQRFAGLRLILCEPDDTKREAMIAAVDQFVLSNDGDPRTPEDVGKLVDGMLLIAAAARHD